MSGVDIDGRHPQGRHRAVVQFVQEQGGTSRRS
jgi:hypothetical protein